MRVRMYRTLIEKLCRARGLCFAHSSVSRAAVAHQCHFGNDSDAGTS